MSIAEMSASPAWKTASGAAWAMAAADPMWSPCEWVKITSPTSPQLKPSDCSTASMSPSDPCVPVSTTTAWSPRAKTYAETKPQVCAFPHRRRTLGAGRGLKSGFDIFARAVRLRGRCRTGACARLA